MFTKKQKKEEEIEDQVIKDSTIMKLHPSQHIPTGGYAIDSPHFGGFLNPSQIKIYYGVPYHYFVQEGTSILLYQYVGLPPVEFKVKELHFEKNEIVLERLSKYNFR